MQIPKPSDADKDRFRAVVPENPDVVVKPMFGNLGAFVNGNMFAGLFGPMIGQAFRRRPRGIGGLSPNASVRPGRSRHGWLRWPPRSFE